VKPSPSGQTESIARFDAQLNREFREQWTDNRFVVPGEMLADDVAGRIVECPGTPMRTEELVLLSTP
jgi:hypothetical protein